MTDKENEKKNIKKYAWKTTMIICAVVGLLLFIIGIGIRIYEMNTDSFFYINSVINSFLGAEDLSLFSGLVLLIGTCIVCLLGRLKNKTIRVVSRVLILLLFLFAEYFFISLNGLATMLTEVRGIQSPDGKRSAVVHILHPFFDDPGNYHVYIKTNPVFVKQYPNEEQEEMHFFNEPDMTISWDDKGFIIEEKSNKYSFYYPTESGK